MAEKMMAAVFTEPGGPETLEYREIDRPEPQRGEVLIRVRACGINGFDLLARNGRYHTGQAKPHVLGGDVVGTVVGYGPECEERVAEGANVALHWVRSCGSCEQCLRGFETTCLRYGYLGAKYPGGYAEYVAVPERNVAALGDYSDLHKAAAFPMAFGTSWHMLVTRAALQPGESVLVQAVGSGIGVAAIQIANLIGARVIGSAGAQWKLDRAVELGVDPDRLINYTSENLHEAVMRITGKRGVDVVFEHLGGEIFGDAVRSVARNGRLVTCGGTASYDVSMNIAHVFHKQVSIIGSNSATRWEFEQIINLLREGRFDPIVDRVFPLHEAAKAHAYLDERSGFGKVVLSVEQ
ncbi:zinc-binding dehydrogenase [Nocardioides sp. LHD-245]|uniref:zinc-binding dehydrogenase n=1 Tax=Nocardioides sp. LHD-245 TaxID=3051387 RepID=UPI0027DFBA20|nr:zinc-binding dehydrogenase [Nocardioides sp. LHD-245]